MKRQENTLTSPVDPDLTWITAMVMLLRRGHLQRHDLT